MYINAKQMLEKASHFPYSLESEYPGLYYTGVVPIIYQFTERPTDPDGNPQWKFNSNNITMPESPDGKALRLAEVPAYIASCENLGPHINFTSDKLFCLRVDVDDPDSPDERVFVVPEKVQLTADDWADIMKISIATYNLTNMNVGFYVMSSMEDYTYTSMPGYALNKKLKEHMANGEIPLFWLNIDTSVWLDTAYQLYFAKNEEALRAIFAKQKEEPKC